MAGDCLVQGQGRNLVEWSLVEVAEIDGKGPSDPAGGTALLVIGCRLALLGRFRDRLHAIGQARQMPEQARKLRIDLLGDHPVAVQQLLAAAGIKPGVGPEKGDERGKRPLEPGLGYDRIHSAPDAPDLVQADLVNLVRGEIGRGVAANLGRVEAFTVGQVPGGQGGTGPGQVFGLEEHRDPPLGGENLIADDGRRTRSQIRLDVLRDAVRQMRKGQQKRAVLERDVGLFARGPKGHLGDEFRLDESRHQTPSRIGDLLVVIAGQAGQTRNIGICLKTGADDGPTRQALAEGRKAPVGREGQTIRIKRRSLESVVHSAKQQVPVEAVRIAKAHGLEGQKPPLEFKQGGPTGIRRSRAGIR